MNSLGIRHGKVDGCAELGDLLRPQICGSSRSLRRFHHRDRHRRLVDRSGHQQSEGFEGDRRRSQGHEAELEVDLVERGRVEQGLRGRCLRHLGLLVGCGGAVRQAAQPSGRLRRPQGGRDRLARQPVGSRLEHEEGGRAAVHQLHDRPEILRGMGDASRRTGLGQHRCDGAAPGRRLESPDPQERISLQAPVHVGASGRAAPGVQ